jgi:hypothetical protein
MSFGAAERVAMPTTGAPTIGSPSTDAAAIDGAVGVAAVMGADGATDGEFVGADGAGVGVSVGAATATVGVTSIGGGAAVVGRSSRARGAVVARPIAAPHVAQKRCPDGFEAPHAGQIVGPSAVDDFENLNAGASGR